MADTEEEDEGQVEASLEELIAKKADRPTITDDEDDDESLLATGRDEARESLTTKVLPVQQNDLGARTASWSSTAASSPTAGERCAATAPRHGTGAGGRGVPGGSGGGDRRGGPPVDRVRPALRLLAAPVSGALLAAAFPTLDIGPLALVALVPLLLVVETARPRPGGRPRLPRRADLLRPAPAVDRPVPVLDRGGRLAGLGRAQRHPGRRLRRLLRPGPGDPPPGGVAAAGPARRLGGPGAAAGLPPDRRVPLGAAGPQPARRRAAAAPGPGRRRVRPGRGDRRRQPGRRLLAARPVGRRPGRRSAGAARSAGRAAAAGRRAARGPAGRARRRRRRRGRPWTWSWSRPACAAGTGWPRVRPPSRSSPTTSGAPRPSPSPPAPRPTWSSGARERPTPTR